MNSLLFHIIQLFHEVLIKAEFRRTLHRYYHLLKTDIKASANCLIIKYIIFNL